MNLDVNFCHVCQDNLTEGDGANIKDSILEDNGNHFKTVCYVWCSMKRLTWKKKCWLIKLTKQNKSWVIKLKVQYCLHELLLNQQRMWFEYSRNCIWETTSIGIAEDYSFACNKTAVWTSFIYFGSTTLQTQWKQAMF